MEPGVYLGMPNEIYQNGDGVSKSQLDYVAAVPALLPWSKKAPTDPDGSQASHVGTALHCLLLEPEEFETRYIVEPGDFNMRTNAGKAARAQFEAEAGRRKIITADEWDMLRYQRDSVMAHPEARSLLEVQGGIAEASAYWIDPETGLLCRCRPDWWPYPNVVLDVKSTEDPSPWGFGKSALDYRYYVQDPFYSDGIEQATGTAVDEFFFLAIGKKREMGRYPVRLHRLKDRAKSKGREEYRENLLTVQACLASGEWPGIEDLDLPTYAYR